MKSVNTLLALAGMLALVFLLAKPPVALSQDLEITSSDGFDVTWDGNDGEFYDNETAPAVVPNNAALAANGSKPFASNPTSPHNPPHDFAKLNDGFYGNSYSHINGGGPDPIFMGITLPGEVQLTAVAWGRDNGTPGGTAPPGGPFDCCGGQLRDRCVGFYTLQITTVANPDGSTDDDDWTTIAELDYFGTGDDEPGDGFTPWLRHQFEIATDGGEPISATGVRILVSDPGICIDEIELYVVGDLPIPQLVPVEEGGEIAGGNLAAGQTAFAKDVLAGRQTASLNDQAFGDASAWIGGTPDSFAGVRLDGLKSVRSIAFGRDNTGAQTDRSLGEYALQITEAVDPDETTPDADWTTIGTILYKAGDPAEPHLRHRFNFGTEMGTGIRLLTPDGAAIDELEVYETTYVPPPPPALTINPAAGYSATWDGNDGDFYDNETAPALVPDNAALATNGSTPFASNPTSPHNPPHDFANLNDGFYGNSYSHINGAGPDPSFMGIALPDPIELVAVAWGRDNGTPGGDAPPGGEFDCCGGQLRDRTVGLYTLQFTIAANPDETTPDGDWTTIAEFNYTEGPDDEPGELFTEYLRHQFEIGTAGGDPILATGIRIIVPNTGICIDEIELYGKVLTAPFEITSIEYNQAAAEVSFTWNSKVGVNYVTEFTTDLVNWTELDDGVEGEAGDSTTFTDTEVPPDALERYYRVRVLN